MRYRTGYIYEEFTYKRYVRGVGLCWRRRFVAEIQVAGKRFRCRSTNPRNVQAWLNDMLEKYPVYGANKQEKLSSETNGKRKYKGRPKKRDNN